MEVVSDASPDNSMIRICPFFRSEDAFGFGIPTPWLISKPCKSGESGLFARGAYEDIIVHQSCVMGFIAIYDKKGKLQLSTVPYYEGY